MRSLKSWESVLESLGRLSLGSMRGQPVYASVPVALPVQNNFIAL